MNYYEHHIRDYDAATSHLTWDEDLAYTRLIRWYYRKEKPVPADIKEACRQIRATSKLQRESVENVLMEFFILCDDGWHNETCDEIISRFHEGEPEREAKKANEENRLKRHRDERSKLFKTLTDAGEHAPWNIKIEDLRSLVKAVSSRAIEMHHETKPATPATAPATLATATQAPIPNTHTLKPVHQAAALDQLAPEQPPPAAAASTDPILFRAIELTALLTKRGAALQASDPRVRAWAEQGVTDTQALQAIDVANERRQQRSDPRPINAGLLDAILGDIRQLPAANARGSPPTRRQTAADEREAVSIALTGRKPKNEPPSARTTERDITGESTRIA